MMFSMNDMVPQNHMLRLIDRAIDWNFIYDLVEEKYCPDNGRPSMDPVMLIKIPFIQYLYGIKSMRQTMKEIEVRFIMLRKIKSHLAILLMLALAFTLLIPAPVQAASKKKPAKVTVTSVKTSGTNKGCYQMEES